MSCELWAVGLSLQQIDDIDRMVERDDDQQRRRAGCAEDDEVGRLGWMALALTPEMGPTRIAQAMAKLGADGSGGETRAFRGAERVFEASLTEWRRRECRRGGAVCGRWAGARGGGERSEAGCGGGWNFSDAGG